MFEIGFSEILLIFVIALIVLGPERLPKLAAQVGRWAGRAKSMARQFREQLESEVDLEAALNPTKSPKQESSPAPSTQPPAPPAAPEAASTPADYTSADGYSAAHDPASEAYATPAHEPLRDRSEDPPAAAPVADPSSPAPPVQVDAFGSDAPSTHR